MTQTTAQAESSIFRFGNAALFIAVITLYRLYFLFTSGYDLYADEAQYWHWAQQFDFGYYSKPPMVAWMIMLTTSLCGDGEACIRLASPLAWAVTSLLVYAIGRELFDRPTAFFSAVVFATLPAVTLSSALISTDPFFLLFWALSLLAFIRALRSDRWRWWILTGIAAGLGLLSKYTMVLFAVSALTYLLWSEEHRHHLKNLRLWAGAGIAFLLYLPNLLWNIDNDFVSYRHTGDNANLSGPLFHPHEMFEFLGAQFAVFGPLLFAVLLYLFCRWFRITARDEGRLLLSFIVPFLGLITLISLLSRAHANWAAPVYIAATVLVVSWLVYKRRLWVIHFSIILHLLIAGVFYHFDSTLRMLDLDLPARKNPFSRLVGGSELGAKMTEYAERFGGDIPVLTDERKTAALLTYYMEPRPFPRLVKWNADQDVDDYYDMTTTMFDKVGQDFLFVSRLDDFAEIVWSFRNNKPLDTVVIPLSATESKTYHVYHLKHFKGY